MKNHLRRLSGPALLWVFAALVTACGGGGDSGTAPVISNLSVAPPAAYNTTDPLTFSSQFDFQDSDGNVSTLTQRVRDEADGSVVDLGTIPIAGIEGLVSGTVFGAFLASGVPPGTYTLLIQVTDSTQLSSNVLGAPIRIAAYPWTSRLAGPTPREHAAAAVLDGKVYLAGGQRTDSGTVPGPATAIMEVYDPATDTWSAATPMPTARMGLTLSAHNGRLYAIGGRTDGYSNSATGALEIYNPATNLWTSGTSMTTPRYHAAAAVATTSVGDLIVVAGGESADAVLATVEGYNPVSDAWIGRSPMPTARGQLAMAAIPGQLFAVGGYAGVVSQWVGTVESYDPLANTWTGRAAMPTARSHLALTAINGQLLAAGGEATSRALDVLERYDPTTNSWRTVTPSQAAFTRAASAVAGERMYVFGNLLSLQYDPANEIR